MSKISDLTFKGKNNYVTQNYSNKHKATDYGTNRLKIPMYAIEDGKVTNVYKDSYGANIVKIYYPRIDKTFTYAHLDKVFVKKNQEVNSNTEIGTTGMTGKATGIHLHLAIYDNKQNKYLDPEIYSKEYTPPSNTPNKEIIYIVKKGDNLSKIAKKFNTTWQKIYKDNKDIIGNNPNLIYHNQKLIIK